MRSKRWSRESSQKNPLCQGSCRMSGTSRQVMIPPFLACVYTQEEGPVGAVGNPKGFPSGSLESRSDFKGPVEDLRRARTETNLESVIKSSTGPSAAAASIGLGAQLKTQQGEEKEICL